MRWGNGKFYDLKLFFWTWLGGGGGWGGGGGGGGGVCMYAYIDSISKSEGFFFFFFSRYHPLITFSPPPSPQETLYSNHFPTFSHDYQTHKHPFPASYWYRHHRGCGTCICQTSTGPLPARWISSSSAAAAAAAGAAECWRGFLRRVWRGYTPL